MIRASVGLTTLLCLLIGLAPCSGLAQPTPGFDFQQPPATVDGIAAAASRVKTARCRTSACRAIVVIDRVLQISDDSIVNIRFGAVDDNDQPRIARRRLEQLLLRHKALYGPTCVMAARIMSRINLASDPDQLSPGVVLTGTAVDMDRRDHGHCATRLMAALPRVPDNDRIRINSRALCLEDHPHPRAACDALARGAIDRGY